MKILIIEDDHETVEFISLSFRIANFGATLISTDHGNEGVSIVESESPDLIILDLGLPDINGFEVIKMIRLFSSTPIIVLTVRHEETYIVKALEYGADDYMTKPFKQMELLARVKAIYRRSYSSMQGGSSITFSVKGWLFNCEERLIYKDGTSIKLTFNECVILTQLLSNAGQIVTYRSLADSIWGMDYPGFKDAIKVYIRRLRQKLETVPELAELIFNKPGIGYYINRLIVNQKP